MKKKKKYAFYRSDDSFRLLFNNMADGFAYHKMVYDSEGKPVDYVFLDVNCEFELQTGLKRENLIGKHVREVMPNTESYWIETYGRVALTGVSEKYENYSQELQKWYAVNAYSPRGGYFAVIVRDITERKQTVEAIEKLNSELESKVIKRTLQLQALNSKLEAANAGLEEFNAKLEEEIAERQEAQAEIIKLNPTWKKG